MRLAKKLLLSLGVMLAFVIYSIQQRHDAGEPTTIPEDTASMSSGQQHSTTPSPSTAAHLYKDGTYTGEAADAFYGPVQVETIIASGVIKDVVFLQYPNDQRNSVEINSQAMPYLKQEAITAQRAEVDIITGATDTSQAFIQSLASALTQAKL